MSQRSNSKPLFKTIGHSVGICHLSIEGISRAKSDYLSRLMSDENVDLVVLQETHTKSSEDLFSRAKICGFKILSALNHPKYGIATLIKNEISDAEIVRCSDENLIFVITVKVQGITITNVYKPPSTTWNEGVLPSHSHPSICAGDFNSHHSLWRYANDDPNGEALVHWAESSNMSLLFDAKDKGTFHSAMLCLYVQ